MVCYGWYLCVFMPTHFAPTCFLCMGMWRANVHKIWVHSGEWHDWKCGANKNWLNKSWQGIHKRIMICSPIKTNTWLQMEAAWSAPTHQGNQEMAQGWGACVRTCSSMGVTTDSHWHPAKIYIVTINMVI